MNALNTKRRTIFISYSHKDREWLDRLRVHMKPLERSYDLDIWDDTRIRPGSRWNEEIREALESARIAVLLVSADFLASDFITTNELPPLLGAAKDDGAIILPVIVSPSRFLKIKSLAKFQAVNDPAMPLIEMSRVRQEDIFVKVVDSIEDLLSSLGEPDPSGEPPKRTISDDEVDMIARRMVELLGDKAVRDISWEVVPDLAEVMIHDVIRQLLDSGHFGRIVDDRVKAIIKSEIRHIAQDVVANMAKGSQKSGASN